jgi:hypothetical protein
LIRFGFRHRGGVLGSELAYNAVVDGFLQAGHP